MPDLLEALLHKAKNGMILIADELDIAQTFCKPLIEIEIIALNNGICPARYSRNIGTISQAQQADLLSKRCVVLGCGGLGGYIIESLARLGIGKITAVDYDVFDESNMNRQWLSSKDTLGKSKAEVAKQRVTDINPAIEFVAIKEQLNQTNAETFLAYADVAIDALDNFSSRCNLLHACGNLSVPLISGSVAGWYGTVYICYDAYSKMEALYASYKNERGIETDLGNPAFMPAIIASIQSTYACKVLLNMDVEKTNKFLSVDALTMSFDEFIL
ncbi:MAG: HesA/MoeB/ThiF family protein [Deltaproteobacteria bacterium]